MGTVAFISFNIFIIGFIYIRNNIKGRISTLASKPKRYSVSLIFWIAFVIRFVLAPMNLSFSSDIGLFSYWSQQGANDLLNIYSNASFLDYPPFYIYILSFIGMIGRFLGLSGGEPAYVLLLKLPSILADLATAYILYRLAAKRLSGSWPIAIAALYAFNPAIILDTAMWGQVDSFLVMLLAAGFYLMDSDSPQLCALPFATAVLTKPQGLIIMPLVLFVFLKRRDVKLLLKTLVYGIGTAALLALPFMIVEGPKWLFDLYLSTAGHYSYASLNAFNFFAMLGANLKQDSETFILFSYKIWGFIFIFITVAYTAIVYIKGKGKHLSYLGGLLLTLGVFVLSVRMHERYMFPVMFFFLAIFILTRDKWSLIFYGISSATIFVNIYVVLEKMLRTGDPHVYMNDQAYGDSVALIITSIVNVLLLIAVAIWSWRIGVSGKINQLAEVGSPSDGDTRDFGENLIKDRDAIGQSKVLVKKDIIIMTIMTVVYLAIAFINLGGFEVPQTEWYTETSSDGFVIELPEEAYVSRLTYYCGLGDNGSYNVWYKNSSEEYQKVENLMEEDEFYKWKFVSIGAQATHLRVKTISPGGSLHEIAVFGEKQDEPLPIRLLDLDGNPIKQGHPLYNLVDEQHIAKYSHDYKTGTYFDEIYHARTAYEHLNKIKPYEWTHPPFGKILISIGISIFGMNTFGWRFIGTLFGAAMIPIMYIFGKKLFKKSFYGFCAAFLMMFDLMHFAQTRIATIDSYTTFFVILMYYFMADYYLNKPYKKGFGRSLVPLFLSGLFFGLGAATKWSALYGAPGLALIFFIAKYNEFKDYRRYKTTPKENRPSWVKEYIPKYLLGTLLSCVAFFVIIPGAIYLLSYIPYLQVEGMTFKDIIDYQSRMYNYHSGLEASHSFQSNWWSWPLLIRPIWYYRGPDMPTGMASTISSFGNPAIWWAGIVAYFYIIKESVEKNKLAIFLIIPIVTQLLPWTMISRAAFIYHFFPILPFIMLAIVYGLKRLLEKGIDKRLVYTYLAIVLVTFVIFYPVVSALLVPEPYVQGLELFPSWVFWN